MSDATKTRPTLQETPISIPELLSEAATYNIASNFLFGPPPPLTDKQEIRLTSDGASVPIEKIRQASDGDPMHVEGISTYLNIHTADKPDPCSTPKPIGIPTQEWKIRVKDSSSPMQIYPANNPNMVLTLSGNTKKRDAFLTLAAPLNPPNPDAHPEQYFWILPLGAPSDHDGTFYIISLLTSMHLTLDVDWDKPAKKEKARQFDQPTRLSAWHFRKVLS